MLNHLLNLGAVRFSLLNKLHVFQITDKIICVEFQRVPLNFYHNILPIHWKIQFLFTVTVEHLTAHRFESPCAFFTEALATCYGTTNTCDLVSFKVIAMARLALDLVPLDVLVMARLVRDMVPLKVLPIARPVRDLVPLLSPCHGTASTRFGPTVSPCHGTTST